MSHWLFQNDHVNQMAGDSQLTGCQVLAPPVTRNHFPILSLLTHLSMHSNSEVYHTKDHFYYCPIYLHSIVYSFNKNVSPFFMNQRFLWSKTRAAEQHERRWPQRVTRAPHSRHRPPCVIWLECRYHPRVNVSFPLSFEKTLTITPPTTTMKVLQSSRTPRPFPRPLQNTGDQGLPS